MSGVDIQNLNVWFGQGDDRVDAVIDASLHVEAGGSFGLVGESGSGKSTILRAMTGLVPDWVIKKLAQAPEKEKASIEIFADIVSGLKDLCQGVHIITIGGEQRLRQYMDAAKLK